MAERLIKAQAAAKRTTDNAIASIILENTINPALDLLKCSSLEARSNIEHLALDMKNNKEFYALVIKGKFLLESGQYSEARTLTHCVKNCDEWLSTYFRKPFPQNPYH